MDCSDTGWTAKWGFISECTGLLHYGLINGVVLKMDWTDREWSGK